MKSIEERALARAQAHVTMMVLSGLEDEDSAAQAYDYLCQSDEIPSDLEVFSPFAEWDFDDLRTYIDEEAEAIASVMVAFHYSESFGSLPHNQAVSA
jgi:hypothetical protein